MQDGKFDFNDDDLNSLLEQLEGLEDLGIDFGDAKALGEMANSVTDDELDALLTNHETDDGDIPDDFGFFSHSKEDGDSADSKPQEKESIDISAEDTNEAADEDDTTEQAVPLQEPDGLDLSIQDAPEEEPDEEEIELAQDMPAPETDGIDLSIQDAPEFMPDEAPIQEDFSFGGMDTDSLEPDEAQESYGYLNELGGTDTEPEEADLTDIFGIPEITEASDDSEIPDFSELLTEPEMPEPPKEQAGDDDFFGASLIDAESTAEDDILMPDFGFNESFTTGNKGEDTIRSARSLRERKVSEDIFDAADEAEGGAGGVEEPVKVSVFKKLAGLLRSVPSILYGKLPGPVRNMAGNVIAPAASKAAAAVKRKRSQKFKMIATAVVMFIVLAISSFILYGQYRTLRTLIEENKVIAKNQSNKFNYANYIFTENKKTINGIELTLKRLVLDEYMCSFHFDKIMDMNRCFAELRDNNNKYYGIYMPLLKQLGKASVEEDAMTLWFEGVDKEAESLYLTLWDSETKESAVFEVDMAGYEMLPAKYIESPRGARTAAYDLNAVVEGGVFSSGMSTVVYKLEGKDGTHVTQVTERGGAPLILENTDRAVAPLLKTPLLYKVNDTLTVGRMDFGPVRSLENRARLTLSGLYSYFNINETVSAAPLFNTKDGMRFDLEGGALVLEGMEKGPGLYVSVFHFENKFGERVSGTLDLNLLIKTYTGVEIRLNPFIRSKTEGGDILFEYKSPNSVVDNAGPEDVYIELRSVMLNMEDADADLPIPQSPENAESASYADISKFIEEAYGKRLAVKSGTGDKNELSNYFSAGVLENEELNKLYEPQATTQAPEYAVVAGTLAKLSRFEYFAVVDESWLGVSNSDRTHIYNSHKIIIEQNGNNFVITSDELID